MTNKQAQRLDLETWKNIFRNVSEIEEDENEFGNEVEVIWMDTIPEVLYDKHGTRMDGTVHEWILAHGYDMFEDGFASEEEAWERLNYLEGLLL